jgi:uncharacterized membrane protein YhaH (DUF805 family)
VAGAIGGATGDRALSVIAGILFYVVFLLPSIAVAVRRLHDRDKSGWWLLPYYGTLPLLVVLEMIGSALADSNDKTVNTIGIILIVADALIGLLWFALAVVVFIWLCTRGVNAANRFGPNPLPTNV